MKNFFEIRSQTGFSRQGRINWNNQVFSTPNVLLPTNSLFQKYYEQIPSLIITKEKFPGFMVEDPLKILPNPENIQISKVAIDSIFNENKTLLGVAQNVGSQNYLPILNENYPAHLYFRYQEYNNVVLEKRLDFYEQQVFLQNPSQSFVLEFRFDPDMAHNQILINWINKNQSKLVGIKILDILKDLSQFETILPVLFKLKQNIPTHLLWILGGKIDPCDYAMALYLGFDLIDLRSQIIVGAEGLYLSHTVSHWLKDLRMLPCTCSACLELTLKTPTNDIDKYRSLIIRHNIHNAISEMTICTCQMEENLLRTYLEGAVHYDAGAVSCLRWIDFHYAKEINSRYPIINTQKVVCIGTESYTRPEVQNFIQRIQTNITPAEFYPIVVLLPCSAGKPYSGSKTHRKFGQMIRKAAGENAERIHQVIITSPLGVVPRECESIFPAAHYDIPVTGDWDTYEVESTGEYLAHWLKKYKSPITVIAHVTGGYRRAVKHAENLLSQDSSEIQQIKPIHIVYTIVSDEKQSAASEENLDLLRDTLIQEIAKLPEHFADVLKKSRKERSLAHLSHDEIVIRATFDYQFGKGVGDYVIQNGAALNQAKNCLMDEILTFDGAGKLLLGTIPRDSGLIKLSAQGGRFVSGANSHIMHITLPDMQGTTVFRPILGEIDMSAHPGDEIMVVNPQEHFLGVAELIQAPIDAIRAKIGRICSIRKKYKPSKDDDGSGKGSGEQSDIVKEMLGDDQ